MIVAASSFALAIIAMPELILLATCAIPLSPGLYNIIEKIEKMRATKALDRLAINLFVNKDSVPGNTMEYLKKHPTAVQGLCKLPNADLKKCNYNSGETLLEEIVRQAQDRFCRDLGGATPEANLSIFKMLVNKDNEDDRTQYKRHFTNLLRSCSNLSISNDLTPYLIYLLEKQKVQPIDFNCDEQVTLWTMIDAIDKVNNNEKFVQTLIKHGFDINVKNNVGMTPLKFAFMQKDQSLIRLLLQNGATPPSSETIIYPAKKMSLEEFLKEEPKIREILEHTHPENGTTAIKDDQSSLFSIWKPAIDIALKGKYQRFQINHTDIELRTMLSAIPILISAPFCYCLLFFAACYSTTFCSGSLLVG